MIRRHPHVFHETITDENGQELTAWEDIKKYEKKGKEWTNDYLPDAFDEAKELIDRAKLRKGFK